MLFEHHFKALGIQDIARKVAEGERLDAGEGERLFACPDPTAVGTLAHHARTRLHGDATFYVKNRHVNYTNICKNGCTFCAFSRERGQDGAFSLTPEEAAAKIAALPAPPREIHVVGGCHPNLGLDYAVALLDALRGAAPSATLKCFTAEEIDHFARQAGVSPKKALTELKAHGLAMMPGGGAEIFAPRVREKVCPNKVDGPAWLAIHRTAHKLGLPTNCTMLFGHIETPTERVEHLIALRELQDETGGFTCFIPLPFLTENSRLKIDSPLTGIEELRAIAVARLMLDNIPHVKAYWVMLGLKQAQMALFFGADDLDGTVVEEKIGHMAGADSEQALSVAELTGCITGLGLKPVERDADFKPVAQGGAS